MLILFYCLTSLRFHIRVIFALYYYYYHYYYSGTCLIRHTKRPGKCVRLDRMSEYSVLFQSTEILWDRKYLLYVTGCRKTQVSDCTSSTVLLLLLLLLFFFRLRFSSLEHIGDLNRFWLSCLDPLAFVHTKAITIFSFQIF